MYFATPAHALTYDTATTSNFTIRFDAAYASGGLTYGDGMMAYDLNGNGKKDLIIGERGADNNSRTNSGSVYIIYDSLLETLITSPTGNIVDLADSTKWNVRLDGETNSGSNTGFGRGINVTDIDEDGDLELYSVSLGYSSNKGALYQIPYSLFSGLTGTGNTFDVEDTSHYKTRWVGHADSDFFGCGPVEIEDVNGDGDKDIVVAACLADFAEASAGAAYIFFNSLVNSYTGTGNQVSVSSSSSYSLRIDGSTGTSGGDQLGWNGSVVTDVTQDGKNDLLIPASRKQIGGISSIGSLYIISSSIIDDYSGTGNTVGLSASTAYTLRIDGHQAGNAALGALLGYENLSVTDYDNDGYQDIVVGEVRNPVNTDFATDPESFRGYTYLINSDTVAAYTGTTGNIIAINSDSTYDYKFIGQSGNPARGTQFAAFGGLGAGGIRIPDLDNNGTGDIALRAYGVDLNSRTDSGATYIVFDSLLSSLSTSTFNDVTNSSSYSFRYDGATADSWLGWLALEFEDVNGDGSKDALIGAWGETQNSRSLAGSLYLIYYFPHTITHTQTIGDIRHPFVFKGTVTAPNNPTHIKRVQWGHARTFGNLTATVNTDFANAWIDCSASDGAFDSNSEEFSCSHSALDGRPHFTIPHTVFIRAQDEKGIWTPTSNYLEHTFRLSDPHNEASTNRDPQIRAHEGRDITDSGGGATAATVIVSPGTVVYHSYLSVDTIRRLIPLRFGFSWQVGEIKQLWLRSFANNAKILIPEKPSIVTLSYTDNDLIIAGNPKKKFSPMSLRLAHSPNGITGWKLLPTSVVDPVNYTVSAIHRVGGWYVLVSTPLGITQPVLNVSNTKTPPAKEKEIKGVQPSKTTPSALPVNEKPYTSELMNVLLSKLKSLLKK